MVPMIGGGVMGIGNVRECISVSVDQYTGTLRGATQGKSLGLPHEGSR